MEIRNEIVTNVEELTPQEREEVAMRITNYFNRWDKDRQSQITTAEKILAETYLSQPPRRIEKGMEWKSDVKLNQIYNIKRTKKSVLWREMWSNPKQMFDVRGTNEVTQLTAKIQKAAIVDSLQKMDIGKQYDEAIDNLFDIGEMIFKTDWEQRRKVVKRQKKGFGWVMRNVMRNFSGAGYVESDFNDIEIPYYENARVECISPFMFVFDHSKYKLKNKDSWDSCIKIYKRFDTLDNIIENKVYDITPEMISDLNQFPDNVSAENEKLVNLREKDRWSGQYSVLYAHGDFKINGKLYRNYIAEVLAGRYLIRFEENPMFINPFILCALEYDPLTKRGISPLKSAYDMCKIKEELTNTAFDLQKLVANPPCWANEDLLTEENTEKDGSIRLAPGKFIKFKNDYAGGTPKEVSISAAGIQDLLTLLDNKIAEISSVSSVMYGNIENSKRTATELDLADRGSSSQVSKELDIINQDLTIPMIKNVAELLAIFKDGTDYVYMQEKGRNLEYRITNEIRQAQYNYLYEDRNAILDRKSKFNQMFALFETVGKNAQLFKLIDWREVIETAVEMVGFDNTDKFFISNPEE